MITVYRQDAVPKEMEIIRLNDVYFNKHTSTMLDERAGKIIQKIDRSEWLDQYLIKSQFDHSSLSIDKLSTGCKTLLNIMYNQDKVFDIRECGDEVLDMIYSLEKGNICCDYPLISFDMESVKVCDRDGIRTVDSYEELKEWWNREN